MKRNILMILALVTTTFVLGMAPQSHQEGAAAQKIRVGVYDNRAVLFAWFHSKYNDIPKLHKELEQAKKEGNDERVKELEAMGPKLQRLIHFQGFGRAPVTDRLKFVKDQLPGLAQKLGVDVIAFECDYSGDNVEVIDISLDLAKLYDPSPDTLKSIREIMSKEPVPLEDLRDED